MKITHCKLEKKVQKELLRFFVLEVTARSAADILGIHPNSATERAVPSSTKNGAVSFESSCLIYNWLSAFSWPSITANLRQPPLFCHSTKYALRSTQDSQTHPC